MGISASKIGNPPERRRGKRPTPPPPPQVTLPGPIPAPPPPPPEKILNASGLAAHEAIRLRNLLAEKALRKIDALNLYRPLVAQSYFHGSLARIRLLRGSNRGGKTLPAAVEVARAVTGQDPHGKYPREDGRWYCVGKDLSHVGEVMWRKLSRAGAFKIIRDLATREWRAFRPWDPLDLQREDEARSAPPLIPPRFISKIAWENKGEEIPSKVKLINGWEMNFYSSLGKPPQGTDLDGVWFDEEIVDPAWFPEMRARLLDRKGRFIWSATPQAGTEQLYDLHERAEKERFEASPGVQEYVILLADNPHLSEKEKRELAQDLSDEDRRVRIDGDFAITSFRVYPEFNMLYHGVDLEEIPPNWTRYMVVDPGHQVCAVLFAAVPPKMDQVVIYDELYLRECDARKFALAVSEKTRNQTIQASIIDPNMAVHTELGTGKTVGQQYGEALAEEDFCAIATGTSFILGCDDVDAGLLAVHGWLRRGEDGTPFLRVRRGHCPNIEDEFKRYVKMRTGGVIQDKPNNRRNNHLMDDLRYLALYQPRWIAPPPPRTRQSPAVKAFKRKQERQGKNKSRFVNLGPGRSPSHA